MINKLNYSIDFHDIINLSYNNIIIKNNVKKK